MFSFLGTIANTTHTGLTNRVSYKAFFLPAPFTEKWRCIDSISNTTIGRFEKKSENRTNEATRYIPTTGSKIQAMPVRGLLELDPNRGPAIYRDDQLNVQPVQLPIGGHNYKTITLRQFGKRKDDNMRQIRVEDAVGTALAHDMTRIIPGKFKGVGFKRNHRVKAEDIAELLKIGKKNLYVLELEENQLHEDDAALRIAGALCGQNIRWTQPVEGKSNMVSEIDGLLQIDLDGLLQVNSLGEIIVSTVKTGLPCREGQIIAATRIIPLFIESEKINEVEDIGKAHQPVFQVLPYYRQRIGLVVTGSEIHEGLIPDGSDKWVIPKLKAYGCEIVQKILVTDDAGQISAALTDLKTAGCELIVTTGGLSVDPDDVTRQGVRAAGAEIISYGTPILPGAMFLNARLGDVPILGLPACVFYHPRTVFDLMLPRLLAGKQPTVNEIAAMGHGGLCMNCKVCHFPACSFGR